MNSTQPPLRYSSADAPAPQKFDGNGVEFIARRLVDRLKVRGSKFKYIEPGKPWQNSYSESFNGHFRDECLDMEAFHNRAKTRVVIESWRARYNHERLHSSLGYRPPAELRAAIENGRSSKPPAQGVTGPFGEDRR